MSMARLARPRVRPAKTVSKLNENGGSKAAVFFPPAQAPAPGFPLSGMTTLYIICTTMPKHILCIAFALSACLPTQAAQALEIWQFDRLAQGDQARFVSGLVRGAGTLLTKAGHADQARKVAQTFPDPDRAFASAAFKSALDYERGVDAKRTLEQPDASRLEVEDALLEMFKKNGIILPDDFYIVNRDFRAKLPVKPL